MEAINNNPFNRPPRVQDNFHPVDIEIPPPPVQPDDTARNLLLSLLPMSSFVIMGLFYAISFGGGTGLGWMYALPMIGMAVFFFLISYITFGEQKHEQKIRWIKQLREYHRLLDKKETRLLAGRALQANLLENRFQRPSAILQRGKNLEISLWERRPEDEDFVTYRLGLGEWPSIINIKSPDPDINSPEIRRAYNLYVEYGTIPNAPVSLDFRQVGSVAFVGNRNHTIPLLRTLIAQVAVLNSPDDVHLFMFSSEPYYKMWKWLRWLPHTSANHVGGDPDYLAFQAHANKELLAAISQTLDAEIREDGKESKNSPLSRAMLLLFDKETGVRDEPLFSHLIKEGKQSGVYSLILCDKKEDVPSDCAAIVEVNAAEFRLMLTGPKSVKINGQPDMLGLMEADTLSRRLLPIAIQTMGQNSRIPSRVNLLQLYNVNRIENLGVEKRWNRKPADDGLLPFSVPIGSETYASPLMIDLAENRDGPHGLIAGTTGSGKSELLQTLVSSLALEHHPKFVNFLLVDFKGASTFGVFSEMPHVVGLVSNLDKLSANRALEAINTESVRRQKFLREVEKEDISEYYQLLAEPSSADKNLKPLPHLFIIVDEFAQMAQEMPGFLTRLVDTARLGRSLGIHLILATQRPAGVVNDQMRANLNFRICLRVQSIDDSRDMLRRSDAAFLPHNLPGRAYFQVGDGGTLRQFQVARAGVDYQPEVEEDKKSNYLYKLDYGRPILVENVDNGKGRKSTKISIAARLAKDLATIYNSESATIPGEIEPILLPPLEDKESIVAVTQDAIWNVDAGNWMPPTALKKGFQAPVGRLDSLSTRTQPPLVIDFMEYGGHVMAVGGPQSGKTYFLETLCYSLAVNYLPSDVQIYILSFAGKGLNYLEKLPHVGSVIEGNETERLHRLLRYLFGQVELRKDAFNEYGTKDIHTYNEQVKPEKRIPYLCILIDNFGELRNLEFDDELSEIEKLINIGRSYGIYFILTALQSNDIPYKISNLIQRRIAFNLSDHSEYLLLVGRPESLEFDVLPGGRCFVNGTTPPLLGQIGLPPDAKEWGELMEAMDTAWGSRPRPREMRILDKNYYLSELLSVDRKDSHGLKNVVGIDGDSLEPFEMDWFTHGPHLLVGGPSQSGRTSLLHTIVLSLASRYSPEQLKIVLMDGTNSSLVSLEELPHVIERVIEEDGLSRNIAHLQNELNERKKDLSNPKREDRPEILFVIDDYDLTCEALAINEIVLSKLGKHIRQDSDLGFHFLISVLPENLSGSTDPLIRQLRLARSGISLSNVETLEMLGARPNSAMRTEELSQGRGYLFSRSGIKLIQFANPDKKLYRSVFKKWAPKYVRAVWTRPANAQQIEQVRSDSAPVLNAEQSSKSPARAMGGYIDQDEALRRYIHQQRQLQAKKGD